MAKTQILEYTIYLRDPARVAALQAQLAAGQGPGALLALPTGGLGVYRAPTGAAIEFGTASGGSSDLPLIEVGGAIPSDGPGYITSSWFTGPTGFQRNVAKFTRSTGWWLFGTDTTFYWSGQFALAAGGSEAEPVPPAAGLRYWLDGFEQPWAGDEGGIPGNSPGTGAPVLDRYCRAASRTGDGVGARFVVGNVSGVYDAFMRQSLRPYRENLSSLWERFYIRPLRYGSATFPLWQASDGRSAGYEIGLTSGGQFALFPLPNTTKPLGPPSKTFGAAPLNAWTRVDVCTFFTSVDAVRVEVRVNGALLAEDSVLAEIRPLATFWQESRLGCGLRSVAAGSVDVEVDFDDWVGGAVPADVTEYARGSHIVRVTAEAFGPAHNAAAWTGDLRTLQSWGYMYSTQTQAPLTATVASAVLEVTLPLTLRAEAHPQSQGIASWRVLVFGNKDGGSPLGSLGYQVGEDTPVLTPHLGEGGPGDHDGMTGQPAGGALLPSGTSLRLRYVKSADTVASRVWGLSALVELVGVFGPEDAPGPYPKPVPVHQNAWPRSPWAHDVLPLGPVIRVGGTYVGDGLPRDLLFPLPPAWLLIRPASDTGTRDSTRWWPSMLWANAMVPNLSSGTGIAVIDTDPTFVPASADADQHFQVRVRLRGAPSRQNNEPGVTYQYCALLDPAGRFCRAFATVVRPAGSTSVPGVPRTWPLDDPSFLPEAAVLVNETTFGSTPAYVWKTPGHGAGDASSLMDNGSLAGALTLAPGAVTIGAGLGVDPHTQIAGLFLRRQDGNATPQPVVFAGSYVGDGAASRVITFGALGRRPLYAHVGAVNSTAQYHRDPSHTGTNSEPPVHVVSAYETTAITAGGLDSFTVGPLLNVLGTTYGYWGLYGSIAPGNNGWSTNGEFAIEADSAKPPGWHEPLPAVEPTEPEAPGSSDPGDIGSDIAAECVEASTRLVNLALSEIGISKQITSLGADPTDASVWLDTSQEAFAARLIYRTLVDTVLRDDDWAFTREYATLPALAGTPAAPVNPDWTYSYKLPADCLRVKRVCVPTDQRRYSVNPVPFDRRAMDLGQTDLLLTNEPGGGLLPEPAVGAPRTVTIEYAKRILCPARVSDAQFRECLVFRLAAGLAKALSRDAADADRCLRNYHMARPRALVNQANDQEPQRPTRGLPDWTTGR